MPSDVICKGFNLGYIRIINTPSHPVGMEHSKDVSKIEYLKDVLIDVF